MSFGEIKGEVARLSAAEREELALLLQVLNDLEDPAFNAQLTQAHAEAERGTDAINREEMLARLRSAGRTV